MPKNKNQNNNSNTSSSNQSTASGSGTSSQAIIKSFDKKLELFIEKQRKEDIKEYSTEHLEFTDEKNRTDLVRFWAIRDLINYEGENYSSNKKFRVKRQNFLTDEELEWAEQELTRLVCELEIYSDIETEEEEGRVSTSEGKEVIKAEISQELEKAKKIFDNFQISPVKHETVKNEITEKLLELHERQGCEAEINLMTDYNYNYKSLFDSKAEAQKKRKAKAEKVAEAIGKTVIGIVSDTLTDLETQKKKISKKIGKLIEARNQEVADAKEIIGGLETINREKENKIEDLRTQIKELNSRLKEFQNKGEQYKKFTQRNIERIIEKPNLIKEGMINEEERLKTEIRELKENLTTALNASEFYRLAEEQKQLELQHKNNELERKENELARITKIADDRQKELSEQIRQLKTKKEQLETTIDEKDEELEQQQPTINRLRTEKETLQTELTKAQNEKQELETKYKALTEKSWFYQVCDKVGIVSFKNSISNASMIAGAVVILYAISWMWKNLLKPTYCNFKGDSENEPQATPTNNQQQPIIHIVKDYPQPQILPQTPEVKVIEVEPPKAVEEKFSAVNPDATPPQNSKKGKVGKKKPKNKK